MIGHDPRTIQIHTPEQAANPKRAGRLAAHQGPQDHQAMGERRRTRERPGWSAHDTAGRGNLEAMNLRDIFLPWIAPVTRLVILQAAWFLVVIILGHLGYAFVAWDWLWLDDWSQEGRLYVLFFTVIGLPLTCAFAFVPLSGKCSRG